MQKVNYFAALPPGTLRHSDIDKQMVHAGGRLRKFDLNPDQTFPGLKKDPFCMLAYLRDFVLVWVNLICRIASDRQKDHRARI
jgi:hypothetical protein